eukprot:TRINITY_DN34958_c0_g1_i1.p1 TRINITY_DN34958_c0_g1~~TRINITY_DN34958_c0_g1_i1.p1  ORF type:complete len:574 (+),score=150.02 TRINITY_DN34958_c0_g1_i1:110-1831(+)
MLWLRRPVGRLRAVAPTFSLSLLVLTVLVLDAACALRLSDGSDLELDELERLLETVASESLSKEKTNVEGGQEAEKPKREKDKRRRGVVLIAIDGVQYEEVMKLRDRNWQQFETALGFCGGIKQHSSLQKTESGPGYATILSGQWSSVHQVKGNDTPQQAKGAPSLFTILDDKLVTVHSYIQWAPIHRYFSEDKKPGQVWKRFPKDAQVVAAAKKAISSGIRRIPNDGGGAFVFAQLSETDDIGHKEGFTGAYKKALRMAGARAVSILNSVRMRMSRTGEDWLVLITTDHGRNAGGKGHGGQGLKERRWFMASSRPFNEAAVCTDGNINGITCPSQTDVAPTVAHFLGASLMSEKGSGPFEGSPLVTIFRGPYRLRVKQTPQGVQLNWKTKGVYQGRIIRDGKLLKKFHSSERLTSFLDRTPVKEGGEYDYSVQAIPDPTATIWGVSGSVRTILKAKPQPKPPKQPPKPKPKPPKPKPKAPPPKPPTMAKKLARIKFQLKRAGAMLAKAKVQAQQARMLPPPPKLPPRGGVPGWDQIKDQIWMQSMQQQWQDHLLQMQREKMAYDQYSNWYNR